MRRTAVVVVLAALALAGAGCGGGGKTQSTAAPAPAPPATTATTATTAPSQSGAKVDVAKPYSEVARNVQRGLDELANGNKIPSAKAFGTPRFSAASRALARDVDGIAAELRAARPPVAVAGLHGAILLELRSIAANFRVLAVANDARDPSAASAALGRIVTSLGRVRADIKRVVSTVD